MGYQRERQPKQLSLALGAQFVEALLQHPASDVRALAVSKGAETIFDSVQQVMDHDCELGFLHSAMCAMSLPVRRPKKNEMAPIIRRDGNMSLIITPLERHEPRGPNGEFETIRRGVPFGVFARLVMFYIMSEAIRLQSREIYLGASFSGFLRRMGITNTSSGGSRGTRSLVQEQIDRLMNCEWTIRWDEKVEALPSAKAKRGRAGDKVPATITAFAVNDMRMVNQYAGVRTKDGDFVSHFVLSEAFYENLHKHSVPMNERAVVVLKKSATQLDLYTWLAYRLPRIKPGDEVCISWADLAKHLGNESATMFKFRQTVRKAWQEVSGVYQQARRSVDFEDLIIRLRHAERPDKGHIVATQRGLQRRDAQIDLLERDEGLSLAAKDGVQGGLALPSSATLNEADEVLVFPDTDHLSYANKELYQIGVRYGSNNDVSRLAAGFRRALGDKLVACTGDELRRRWQGYCENAKPPS